MNVIVDQHVIQPKFALSMINMIKPSIAPPQTLMKAGLADIASMMHKIYAEQSPELCKALQSAA